MAACDRCRRSTSRRCGCSSASGARWRASCRTWCGRCRSWCRRRAIRGGARWRCGSRWRSATRWRAIATKASPDPGTHLPDSAIVSREEALRLNPVIAPEGVTGGAVWYDYQMLSTDRVTLSFLLSAVDAGACAANYVQVTALPAAERPRHRRQASKTRLTNETFAIRGTVVVNAAGPWAASLLAGSAGGGARRAAAPAVARDERDHPQGRERSRVRRTGQRPLPASWCRGATSRCSAPATTRTRARPIS